MAEQSDKPGRQATDAPNAPGAPGRRKTAAAQLSIGSNALLVALKLLVGFMSGSVSVLSEAAHSATDVMAAYIALLSVRASDTPPDAEHPYGHGKIESLSGLAEALLIIGAGVFIFYEAIRKLASPSHPGSLASDAGLLVMGVSAGVNILLSRYLFRVARETDSFALAADALHLRTDIITSLGVLIGLALERLTGFAWIDPVTALLVALLIVRAALRLIRDALQLLLDARLPAEDEAAIQDVLEADARVLGYHKLRTRKSGSQRHADVHVQIDDNCTLVQAHELTEELEDQIRAALPAIHINIHIEPYQAELRHQQEAHGAPALPATPEPPDGAEQARRTKETIPGPDPPPHYPDTTRPLSSDKRTRAN